MDSLSPPEIKNNLPSELQCIEAARQHTVSWSRANNTGLVGLDLVTPSILAHKKFSVWLFYTSDADVAKNEMNGSTDKVKEQFLIELKKLNCPEEYIAGVIFFVDSQENVKRYAAIKPVAPH